MNTTRTGMRTVLAAAAAGALIMGSAAGAMAAPKAKKVAPAVQIQSVSIHGHKAFDVSSPRVIKVRATVRYAKGTTVPLPTPEAKVTLAAYAKKVQKSTLPSLAPAFAAETLVYAPPSSKKDVRYKTVEYMLDATELGALKTAVAAATLAKTKVYLCIADIDVTGVTAMSNQVEKRINPDKGKVVRDCVKVIDSSPAPVAPVTTP